MEILAALFLIHVFISIAIIPIVLVFMDDAYVGWGIVAFWSIALVIFLTKCLFKMVKKLC